MYGLGQLSFQILRMRRTSIDQYRTRLDHFAEARIGPLLAGNSEGFGNGSGIDLFLTDACSCLGPCPVMKEDGHHCVTLKHALRPYRGGLKASTGTDSQPLIVSVGLREQSPSKW